MAEGEGGLVHWDDVEPVRAEQGHIAGARRDLGRAAGSMTVTVNRIEIDPGRWSTRAHVEDEEIFFALGGSGLSWRDGKVYEIREGDCIVHRARGEEHALRAGHGGLDVLAYSRCDGTARLFDEVAGEEPEIGEPAERPSNIVNVGDLEQERWIDLADAAGSLKSGLNVVTVAPGKLPVPAHCHGGDEEIFVILEGDGTLELVPGPRARDRGHEEEHHAVRAGHVVARPAGTQIAHAFRGGEAGLKVLMYGWRDRNDITYYPRSNKMAFRGIGLIARLEPLDYWDGEEPPD